MIVSIERLKSDVRERLLRCQSERGLGAETFFQAEDAERPLRFGKGLFAVTCRDNASIAALDAVLARARALKGDDAARAAAEERYRLLPPSPPEGAAGGFARPFSQPWQTVMAIYALVFFVLFF